MTQRSIFLLLLTVLTVHIFSQPRDSEQARRLAVSFLNDSGTQMQRVPLSDEALQPVSFKGIHETPSLYIFNIKGENGFIVVSGDERARDILAYSNQQAMDETSIPDNLRYWLSVYEDEIKVLRSVDAGVQQIAPAQTTIQPVKPLLSNVKWNQNNPYNLLCPVIDSVKNTKAVVGCVATGMAMVMYYHRWPEKGIGSNTYTTTTLKIPLSLDFSKTTYNWDKMTPTYSSTSTSDEQQAVAELMYHCGVAVKMDYNTSSAAFFTDMGRALINNFGYDGNLQLVHRNFFSRDQWQNYLLTELYAARPTLYGGTSSEGSGHLWVCDGVDQNGYFHFNWGWGGLSNGYYAITALNPTSLGIGGGTGGYNYYQQIITGMNRPNAGSKLQLSVYSNDPPTTSVASAKRSQTFTYTAKRVFNYGILPLSFQIGLGLYNGTTLMNTLKFYQINDLNSYYGWNSLNYETLAIPAGTAAGTYQLRLMHRVNDQQSWTIVPHKVGTPGYIQARLTTDSVFLSSPQSELPSLTLDSVATKGNLYADKTGRFTVTLSNSGKEYNSSVMVRLSPVGTGSTFETTKEFLNVVNGESVSKVVMGTINVTPGEYWMSVHVDVANNYHTPVFQAIGDAVKVRVLPAPVTPPALSLTGLIAFPDNSSVFRNQASLKATIRNQGGMFENYLNAFLFTLTGGSSIGYIGYQKAVIDSLETITMYFKGDIALSNGDYRIGVYYYDQSWKRIAPSDQSMIQFSLVDESGTSLGEKTDTQVLLYPNPTRDELFLQVPGQVLSVTVYAPDGRRVLYQPAGNGSQERISVSNLQAGTYILRVERRDELPLQLRFIKQ